MHARHRSRQAGAIRKLEPGLGLRLHSFQTGDVVLNYPGAVDGQPAAGRRPLLWAAFSDGFSGMFRAASDREVLRAVPAIALVAQAALAREESRVKARRESRRALQQAAADFTALARERWARHVGANGSTGATASQWTRPEQPS